MHDPSDEMSEVVDGGSRSSSPGGDSPQKKTCADCGTSKTPLWRGGPAGPKSLCNACGIRSRKKRRDILGLNKASSNEKKAKKIGSSNHTSSGHSYSSNHNSKLGDGLKQRFVAMGKEVLMLQRSTMEKKRRIRKLGEVEQAAVLLMALSDGSLYA